MKFIADEGIDFPIVAELRIRSHDVLYIAEETPGLDDEFVLKKAFDEKRLLITQDKDFGELVFRLKHQHCGIILLRLEGIKPKEKAKIVSDVIEKHAPELLDSFSVIQPEIVRIRKDI